MTGAPREQRLTMYQKWMQQEGVPLATGFGITDIYAVPRGPWERLGGRGAYIELKGMEGMTGMYLLEIPPGQSLQPERHLYDELHYVLDGRGATEVWMGSSADGKATASFEWQAGSLFAPPMNSWHRLHNASGTEPALVLGITNAPLALDLYQNPDFVFNCDYRFTDRYDGRPDFFNQREQRWSSMLTGGKSPSTIWETNFIADVLTAPIDLQGSPALGKLSTSFEISDNVLTGHIEDWPPGLHDMAHYHGGGAIILALAGKGYTLMWPPEAGIRPYESGNGDKVVRINWQHGAVVSPPTRWFHQHFNHGSTRFRFFAAHYSLHKHGMGVWDAHNGTGIRANVRDGGTQIYYEDEDPEIQRIYRAEVAAEGVEYIDPFALAV